MKTIKSILGYLWAVLALIIALATFFGHTFLSRGLAETTGMAVHPRYSGGEVIRVIDHGTYKTSIHRPVFDGLVGQTREGFIQINWDPAAGLPPVIQEEVDYNGDRRVDFIITLNTGTGEATLAKNDPAVLALDKAYKLRNGWAARVLLARRP